MPVPHNWTDEGRCKGVGTGLVWNPRIVLLFECQRVHARAWGGTHQEATEGDTAPSSVDELTAPLN